MHFTIDRKKLIQMLETVRRKMPRQKRKDKSVRLYACAARVFVEANSSTAGEEALVLSDGGCELPLEIFLGLLKTYVGKENITIEANERALSMFTTTMSISNFTRVATPPAHFVIGKVTDEWVAGVVPGPATIRPAL